RKRAEEETARLEAQLRQAQKMEAVGTLASGIAHDFNNVLQAISGYVQLVQAQGEWDRPGRYISEMERSIQRAADLVQRLLTFSRKVEPALRPLDLNQEIVQWVKMLERAILKMISIELHLADDLKAINADPIQIEQVLMNLAVNAADAMPEGGRLVIETENVILDKEYCHRHMGAKPGQYVLMTVSDTGHGMAKEILEHIFEPFYTTKETGKGTGLGLAMVYGIVKNHAGYTMCHSELGQGTSFKVYLPAVESPDLISAVETTAAPVGGTETVLVVDDEKSVRTIAVQMLEMHGYKVLTASSGEDAVEIYGRQGAEIDLVVLDLGMPGMGGYACLKELLRIDPKAKVLVASGYSAHVQTRETLQSGAKGFIGKPYRFNQMLQKIRQVLDS
ncbi:MAG: response regulator, partial [Deltaproteobacteria bacterium]|nr:response regulator [Deltaproteobacteria bacterium]